MDFNVMIGVVAPFLGTVLGSAWYFIKKDFRKLSRKLYLDLPEVL